jgi:transaldolase
MKAASLDHLKIKIFADGADLDSMRALAAEPHIKGFTTNPTLMRKAGISDYEAFAKQALEAIPDHPISFEVFADDPEGMIRQGRIIGGWSDRVSVKIPVTDTQGRFMGEVISALSQDGVAVNVTAIMTPAQVRQVAAALDPTTPAIVSVFAGRIADTGRDPEPIMRECLDILGDRPKAELLWASPRELLNIIHADRCGCHIITVTGDVLKKLGGLGKDLDLFSVETVRMFHDDAGAAGYRVG